MISKSTIKDNNLIFKFLISECCENDNEVGIITDPTPDKDDDKENEINDDPVSFFWKFSNQFSRSFFAGLARFYHFFFVFVCLIII